MIDPPLARINLHACMLRAGTLGSFFGRGIVKRFHNGQLVHSEVADLQPTTVEDCVKWYKCGCGRSFNHKPALTVHLKFCNFEVVRPTADESAYVARAVEAADQALADCAQSHEEPQHDCPPSASNHVSSNPFTRPMKRRKKDGLPKRSGLQEGSHKTPYSLLYKLRVALEFDTLNKIKQVEGADVMPNPLERTSKLFNGLSTSNIWNWYAQLDKLKHALTSEMSGNRKMRHLQGKIITFNSKKARSMTLHPGRQSAFLAAEVELQRLFKARRSEGKRVNERWLCVNMRKLIRQHYGDEPANNFKGSYGWVWRYAHRHGIALRRANNHKHQSVEERLPKIKRWHARLRRRLKTPCAPGRQLDPKWGRWLPKNRLSIDQVRRQLFDDFLHALNALTLCLLT